MSDVVPVEVDVDDVRPPLKALHGVNLGPVDRSWTRDYSDAFRRAGIPSVRLHDASIMIADVVDLHCLFPDPQADPDSPGSYRFELTDDYLAAIRAAGAEIHFRLGESIEGRRRPHRLYVPLNGWTPQALARVCVNIVRHYNEGWAGGHHWSIRQWNFWNEPDNGAGRYPPEQLPMWTQSPEAFFEYYRAVATALKAHDPTLSVGLASFGNPYFAMPAESVPLQMPQGWLDMIARCAREDVPFDFVSWNDYAETWDELVQLAHDVRGYLDRLGRPEVTSMLTEWNYMPTLQDSAGGYSYMGARVENNPDRYDSALAAMNGVAGAAFVFGSLSALQDAPLDAAFFYTGLSEPWGLFRANGQPGAKWAAFELFGALTRRSATRVSVRSASPGELTGLALTEQGGATIALAYRGPSPIRIAVRLVSGEALAWAFAGARRFGESGWVEQTECVVDGSGLMTVDVPGPGITVLELRPAGG